MLENSRMTQTDQEIAGSARFFRSLLERMRPADFLKTSRYCPRNPNTSPYSDTGIACYTS